MKAFLWSESHHKNDTLLRCPLGFLTAISKKNTTNHKLKTEVTWPEKRLSQWSQQTAMSACESLRPPFGTRLIKTTSILLLNQLMDFIKSPHQPNLTKTYSVCAFMTPRRKKNKDLCLIFALHKAFYQKHQKITPTSTISCFLTNYVNNLKPFILNDQLLFN